MIKGELIGLRQLEPSDATKLMLWENDQANWRVSGTEVPFSLFEIESYIATANDVRANKQLRLVIVDLSTEAEIGAIDFFDISFKHKRAGLGVLIAEKQERGKGYAQEAVRLMIDFGHQSLGLVNFHCSIQEDNKESITVFERNGFQQVGRRENWYTFNNRWYDELLFQKCIVE